ncbi:MAG: YbaY family lipoprotein [Proteobacteria bacterium]|nr:YbaY family lipoprotein [Pseudomonadota bacterium]
MAKIEGTVFYRERIALPPNAVVEIQLEDVSRADAMATVMATLTLNSENGPPYAFSIDYDPARIDSRMTYALRASIRVDDKLMFTTMDYTDPFSGNPVSVLVRRVPSNP